MLTRSFQALFFSGALCLSLQSQATQFAVPVGEELPVRTFLAADATTDFKNLKEFGGQLGLTHHIGHSLEWGATLHGSAISDRLFAGGAINPSFGGDLMFRFFPGLGKIVYLGLQTQVGYTHYFSSTYLRNPGELLVDVGVPLALGYMPVFAFYAMPTIVFGGKSQADFVANKVWGSRYGFKIDAGFAIGVGAPSLFLQVTPRIKDLSNSRQTFDTTFLIGLALNF